MRIPCKGNLALHTALFCFLVPAFPQAIAITSPTVSQNLSGTYFVLTCSLTSLPATVSVEYFVNGESQGIVWSAPWSLSWNTNNIYDSSGAWHTVYAVARDAFGNTLATSPTVKFQILNQFLESASYISLSNVTTSTPTTSNWSGMVNITVTISGTNAGNQKYFFVTVDGIYANSQCCQTPTTLTFALDTRKYLNGVHNVGVFVRDGGGTAPTNGGYPFGEWEYPITFANTTTAMELSLSPKEWVVAPSGTQQLTCKVINTDNSIAACSSPSYSIALLSDNSNSGVCSVNSSGLVTGQAFGVCGVQVTAGGLSRTIYGYVASSNVIPHFGTDGVIHNSYVAGTSFWMNSYFNTTNGTGFADREQPISVFAPLYVAGGWNTAEGPLTDSTVWNTSQTNFTNALNTYIGTWITPILNAYNLYFHGTGQSPLSASSNPTQFYVGIRGIGSTYSPPGWQLLAQTWKNTGRLLGISLYDEVNAVWANPNPHPVISSGGPNFGMTCNASSFCTVTYGPPPLSPTIGRFAIFGATTHSNLNSTVGNDSTIYTYQNQTATTFQFQGSNVANITVTPASDPTIRFEPYVFQWENSNDYSHYQDFVTLANQVHAAGSIPVTAPTAGGSAQFSNCGWMGICGPFDYGEYYYQNGAGAANPAYYEVTNLSDAALAFRTRWGHAGRVQAFLGETNGITCNYGYQGTTLNISSISGKTVTFSGPHSLGNIQVGLARMTIGGSSNPYFNGDWFIDSVVSPTQVNISRRYASASPPNTPGQGTIHWADGTTWPNVNMSATGLDFGAGVGTTYHVCNGDAFTPSERGQYFTWTGSGADPYYTSNTFIYRTYFNLYPQVLPWGNCDGFREVPPPGQTSGPAMATNLLPSNDYVRGRNYNASESITGPRYPSANVWMAAILGGAGQRRYALGGHNNYLALGLQPFGWNDTKTYTVQNAATPLYDNGADSIREYWADTSANLLLQRLATSGYLFQPRFGAPDPGSMIEASLRKGSNGNLLLTLNASDGPQTRTIDLSACAVSGQPTIRYTSDWTGIKIATLSAGTTSDTPTWPAGGAVVYLCSNNAAAELPSRVLQMQPLPNSNYPTGAKVLVEYNYARALFDYNVTFTVDCGNGLFCALPVDPQMGSINLRITILDASSNVLARGDVQKIS